MNDLNTPLQTENMNELFLNMFTYHNAIMLLVNPQNGDIIDANRSASAFYGYTNEEFKSLNVRNINQALQSDLASHMNAAKNNLYNDFEFKHTLKNGTIKDVKVHSSPIKTGNTTILYSIIEDITESKHLKVEILRERNFISTLVNNANAIIAVISAEGVMIRLNKFGQDFIGYSEDEIASEPYFWKRFLPQRMQDKVIDIIKNANEGIVKKSFQNSWISRSGEERFFEWSNTLVQHIDGTMDYLVTVGIDITEQSKQLNMIQEKNLQIHKTQLKFQTLFEESLDGIVLLNPATQQFIEYNHNAYEMYGYSKEEFAILTPKDLEAIHNEKQIIATQQNIIENGWDRFITKHKTKNGVLKDVIVSVRAIIIDNEDILYLTFHDITEQKNKEQQLKILLNEQEALFKVQTAGFVHLKNRNLKWTNETFEKILGYDKGELQGKPVRIIYDDEEEYERYGKEGYLALSSVGTYTKEIKCVKKDGSIAYLLTSMTSLKKDSTEAVGIAFDITESKIQSQIIEKQKEEFETIFNYSKDGIAIIDLDSKFLQFNDAYLEMTGYDRETLLTKSCLELTAPEDRARNSEALNYVLEHGNIQNIEKSCIVNNDKLITVNMSASLLPDKQRFLLVTKDISSVKLFESQAKLASMGEMIGNIAHQWRQPLNVISTMASSIAFKKDFGTLSDEEIIPDMENIITQTVYLSKTIDDFRNFIKGGNVEEVIKISSVLAKTFSIVSPSLKNNYINLVNNIDTCLELKGYENELMQAFINIINNAKDALVSNDTVDDKYIFIEAKRRDNCCDIIIKDNGGGILSSVIGRIFEPYFTTKHQSQGTGLGLSMAYKIITELHCGTIDVSNVEFEYDGKLQKGACFEIKLLHCLVK